MHFPRFCRNLAYKWYVQLHDITFCRVINCSWETYEFNKCTISLRMQQVRIVDFAFNPVCFSKFDKLVREI